VYLSSRNIIRGLLLALLTGGIIGGCECKKGVEETATIDMPSISQENPSADRPVVQVPSHCKTKDPVLNQFIQTTLKSCAEGDYDSFRQACSTSFTPPSYDDFKRLWHGVEGITVVSVYQTPEESPKYFVHATVHLRKPDSRERDKREAVVVIFKEAGDWRMAPPPKEIARKVLLADSQPAPGAATQPAASQAAEAK
jgi:hypothetical protein